MLKTFFLQKNFISFRVLTRLHDYDDYQRKHRVLLDDTSSVLLNSPQIKTEIIDYRQGRR